MDAHFRLQATDKPEAPVPRKYSTPVDFRTPHHQPIKSSNHSCCCSAHVHGCGCGCLGCSCRYRPFKDESNRTAYSSEGGLDIPKVDTPGYGVKGGSLDSNNSSLSQATNNSYEVQDPLTESFHETHYMHRATTAIQTFTAAFASDDEDEYPWPHFISPSRSTTSDDSSGMVFENMEGSSMVIEMGGSTSAVASSLSNYPLAFPRHSMTISQTVAGAGESFPVNNFLRLTPECRHERTRQMCKLCIHY